MAIRSCLSGSFILSALLLAGCGGSSSSSSQSAAFDDYAARLAELQAGNASIESTPEIDLPTGSVNYAGVANFNLSTSGQDILGAYGALTVNVDFTDDTLTGEATDFVLYDGSDVGDAASGTIRITDGVLTGNNTDSITSGLTASASGSIGGRSLDMDVNGGFNGDDGNTVALYFDDKNSLRGGVGIAVAR